jgi:hypothetical protein
VVPDARELARFRAIGLVLVGSLTWESVARFAVLRALVVDALGASFARSSRARSPSFFGRHG